MKWGRKKQVKMSAMSQLIAVLVFLAYSLAYLFFVGWVSEQRKGPRAPLRPRLGLVIVGVGIVLPIAGLCFLLSP